MNPQGIYLLIQIICYFIWSRQIFEGVKDFCPNFSKLALLYDFCLQISSLEDLF